MEFHGPCVMSQADALQTRPASGKSHRQQISNQLGTDKEVQNVSLWPPQPTSNKLLSSSSFFFFFSLSFQKYLGTQGRRKQLQVGMS